MEDSITTVLHSDDKEMLRKRLALLQREYNRTIQRLQRAERSEAVRQHVRSRIAADNAFQTEPSSATPSSPSVLEEHSPTPVNHSNSAIHHKSTAVRFTLSTDTPSPCSGLGELFHSDNLQDEGQAAGPGARRRSAHRLRSRRSWKRWEERERTDSQRAEDRQGPAGQGEGVMGGSSEVSINSVVSQPESLDWSKKTASIPPGAGENCEPSKTAPEEPVKKCFLIQGDVNDNNSIEKCESLMELHGEEHLQVSKTTEVNVIDSQQLSMQSPSRQSEGNLDSNDPSLESECPSEDSQQRDTNPYLPSSDPVDGGWLGSCTLVEGLPFPVEYYVRTTRRMASLQRRVDLEAVILSQLSSSRKGRRRQCGAGRAAAQCSQGSAAGSQPQAPVAEHADNNVLPDPESCPAVDTRSLIAKSHTGKQVKNGGGGGRKGRSQRLSSVTHSIQITPTLGHMSPEPLRTSELVPHTENHVRPETKEVYPIFHMSRRKCWSNTSTATEGCSKSEQMEYLKASNSCSTRGGQGQSLFLQPPAVPQNPTLERDRLSLRFLLSHFDVKDFHLPDEEFGRLKLEKLRSSTTPYMQPHCSPYNTRWAASRGPVGSSGVTGCMQRTAAQSSNGNAVFPAQTSSQNSSPVATSNCKSKLKGGPEGESSFLQHDENRADPAVEIFPAVLQNCSLKKLQSVRDAIPSSQTAGPGEGDGDGPTGFAVVDREPETAGSPQVLNPSLALAATTQHSEACVLLLCESPTFPSLGVTPAVPLHSSIPPQSCSPSAPPTAPGAPAQPTTLSGINGKQTHRALSREPIGGTPSSALRHAPTTDTQGQEQRGPANGRGHVEDHMTEALTGGGPSAAVRSPSSSDSFPLSICGNAIPQCKSSPRNFTADRSAVLSSTLPPCEAACPITQTSQPCLSEAPSPLRAHAAQPGGADCSSSADLAPSQLSCFPDNDGHGEPVNRDQSGPLSYFQAAAEPNGPQAERRMSVSVEKGRDSEDVRCTGSQKRSQLKALSTNMVNSPVSQHPLSQGTQCGDLESYFTDSAWPSGTQVWPACGESTGRWSEAENAAPPAVPEDLPTDIMKLTHTLKAPAGHCLVDVCSVYTEQGWYVVTAGEWTVSVWQQDSSLWTLLHTWTFTEVPILALVPVPDAPGLVCVALGQLEIREARVLSFIGAEEAFSQLVLCAGNIQAVLGVSEARLVSCATAGCTQSTSVVRLTKEGRLVDSLCLVSPDQSVQSLAAVEGEQDALIGATDSNHLVIWNMRTGHLLQRFALGQSLSSTVCLRGFTEAGLLFVLLQHKLLTQEEGVLFSLIAANPVTAGYMLTHSLSRCELGTGRFVDADVRGSFLAAAFQCGTLAVWDLQRWHLTARLAKEHVQGSSVVCWAGPNCLLIGHISGDVSLYQYDIQGQQAA